MLATLEANSTLTDRYQTTVPEAIRRALKLTKRDKIHYTIQSNGAVLLTRAVQTDNDDPALTQFLGFLARDLASHPERIQALDNQLVQRIQSLMDDSELDLNAALSADDE